MKTLNIAALLGLALATHAQTTGSVVAGAHLA
jgi:hypothetical protein